MEDSGQLARISNIQSESYRKPVILPDRGAGGGKGVERHANQKEKMTVFSHA